MPGSPPTPLARLGLAPLPLVVAVLATAFCVSSAVPALGAEPFAVQTIPSKGRTVAADLADVDGDGRQDVVQAVTFGMPPDERRILRVYLQQPDGEVSVRPAATTDIPPRAAVYDIADVDGDGTAEVLFLQPRGVTIVSHGPDPEREGRLAARVREALIPDDLTIAAASDERGLDRLAIASFAFGPEVWLVVPGLGETFFLSPSGELRARIDSGARANYFIQPYGGPLLTESDIQIFFDAPRISVGDVDGDGRPDVVASSRHELLVFLRGEDGSYPSKPSWSVALGRLSIEDHIRGSGSVRSTTADIDGDGRTDLLLSLTVGGMTDAGSMSYVHFNRGKGWDLDRPDAAFVTEDALSADQLIDLDGDGDLEIVRIGIPVTVLELIEIFLQEAVDAWLYAYPLAPVPDLAAGPASPKAMFEQKLAVPLDFETSRPAGFVPTIDYDLNADGYRDYLSSADGSRIDVYLGTPKGFKKDASQKISSEGQVSAGDLEGDGLTDLLLFNSRRQNEPVVVVRNLGRLSRTPPRPVIGALPE